MRIHQIVALAGLALTACFHDEGGLSGASDVDSTSATSTSDGPTSTSASTTTTSSETSAATTAGSTDATTSTTSATTVEPTTTTTDPTTTSTSEPTTSTSTTDSTTGGAVECWDLPPASWPSLMPLVSDGLGAKPRSPRIDPDGLILYYIATTAAGPRVFRAERDTVDDPFLTGTLLIPWPMLNVSSIDAPNVIRGEQEIVLTGGVGGDLQLRIASVMDAEWTLPVAMPAPVNTPDPEALPSVTEATTRMIFQRQDGPVNETLMGPVARLYEAKRPANSALGAHFSDPSTTVLPGITDDSYAHFVGCPAISPDGLHLFFGTSYPLILDVKNVTTALRIFYTRRATIDGPWEPAIEVTDLEIDGVERCPSAVTRDGCTLIFHTFLYGGGNDVYNLYVARRSPG